MQQSLATASTVGTLPCRSFSCKAWALAGASEANAAAFVMMHRDPDRPKRLAPPPP
jgi:hypothetical protein